MKRKKYALMIWTTFLFYWLALAWRLRTPHAEMQTRGTLVWIEILFLLILYSYILLTAYGLGHLFLRFLGLSLTRIESIVLAFILGLGGFSLGIMVIGLAGWLDTLGILAWLALSGFIACIGQLTLPRGRELDVQIRDQGSSKSYYDMLLHIVIFALIPLLLIGVVSPVWDYDALLYHLEIPRQFLAEGRIYFDPTVWRSAYPFLGEMSFLVGMVFGVDSLGKLINLTYAVLFVSSVYTFGLRFLGRQVAVTATTILIGAPAFLLWATWISVDYAWAAYEFWSLYAISLWLTDDHGAATTWLALAGIMSGFAASIKYLSLPVLLIVAAIVAWKSIEKAKRPIPQLLNNLLIYGFSAGLIMGAWYIKNWLWTGNPVYPLVFGGLGWDPLKNQILNDYVHSFGTGKSWLDYLLLPINVYTHQSRFATIPVEIIHPALWLSFFFPFVIKSTKTLNVIVVYAAVCFLWWVMNSQVIRFLIPLSAVAAIMAASVIEKVPPLLRNLLKFGLLGGFMLFGLIHQIVAVRTIGAWDYFLGKESAADVVAKVNDDFSTISYIQDSLSSNDKALFLWDGRGYYCDGRCIPDDEQSTAISLTINSPTPERLAQDLTGSGITHIMLSLPDARWFIAYHDPRGLHRTALDYFTKKFLPACGKSIFHDQGMELFEITCH